MTLLWLLGIITISCAEAQKSPRNLNTRPSLFVPDQENLGLENADPPSDSILNALLATSEANEAHDELAALKREDLRDLFEVVRVNLGPAGEKDYVVHGTSLPMRGAENDWFWIIRKVNRHAEVILFAHGNSLELLTKESNGYKGIRTVWWSAAGYHLTNIYRFDDGSYKLAHAYTKQDRLIP
jgi:hypothetical protein